MNFLTSFSEQDGSLMKALCSSNELEIFQSDLIIDLIDFKWEAYAAKIHKIGFFFHILYILLIAFYINSEYLEYDLDTNRKL